MTNYRHAQKTSGTKLPLLLPVMSNTVRIWILRMLKPFSRVAKTCHDEKLPQWSGLEKRINILL